MEDAGREKMHEDKDEEEGSSVGEVQQAVEPIKVNKPARKVPLICKGLYSVKFDVIAAGHKWRKIYKERKNSEFFHES